MKKVVWIAIMIISILCITLTSFATSKNVTVDFKGQTTLTDSTKTMEFILSIGDLTGIESNSPFGYQANLKYDENLFSSAKVEGLNGWVASYDDNTKILIGDVASVKAKTDITKIILTVKDGVVAGTTGNVSLNSLVLTDGIDDFHFSKDITIVKNKVNSDDTNNENSRKH